MRSWLFTLVLAAAAMLGCSRGFVDPADLPAAPAPWLVRLIITPTGGVELAAGDTAGVATSGTVAASGVALGAYAEYSNGQGRYVEATWSSSDSSIGEIVDNTLVARKPGKVTLTAKFENQTDTEEFTVDGSFFGRWSGSYAVERCEASSGSMFDLLCRPPAGGRSGSTPVGALIPFALTIDPAGGDDITARLSLGPYSGTLTGKNRRGGFFSLSGEMALPDGSLTILYWDMRGYRDVIEGYADYRLRIRGLPGEGGFGGRVVEMNRQP